MKRFLKRNFKRSKVFLSVFVVCVALFGSVLSSNAAYTVNPIPSPEAINFSAVGDLWQFGASMMMDTVAIVSNQPILVALLFALPLVGLGIGLFKRLISG